MRSRILGILAVIVLISACNAPLGSPEPAHFVTGRLEHVPGNNAVCMFVSIYSDDQPRRIDYPDTENPVTGKTYSWVEVWEGGANWRYGTLVSNANPPDENRCPLQDPGY